MFKDFITSLFTQKPKLGSYLVILPPGTTGVTSLRESLEEAYGGPAHPDLMILEGPYKVEDIRNTRAFLQSKAFGPVKTLWISQADTMTNQAANAFLKSLEEPTSQTQIILSTDRPTKLLPTIRSRCVVHSCITDKTLMAKEMEEGGIDKKDMAKALSLAAGDVTTAIALATVKDGIKWAQSVDAWVTQTGLGHTKRPSLPTTGKSGLTPRQCALVFQCAMANSIRTNSNPKTVKVFDDWIKQNDDIDRPGLDIKTRILSWYHLLS